MKRADILKFKDNRLVIHPVNTLKGGGGRVSKPYLVGYDLTITEVVEKLLEALTYSITDAPRPLDYKASDKHYLSSIGVKTFKALHDGTINIGVTLKEGNYHISPTENKGSRQGFQGRLEERIIIPEDSSNEELAAALKLAFDKSN